MPLKVLVEEVGLLAQMTQIVATALVRLHVPLQLELCHVGFIAALEFAYK
jgi:hypothetical protein